ncbi:MAG: ABC transporter ATP-binding protein [Deltaproteobacteria bacterium]
MALLEVRDLVVGFETRRGRLTAVDGVSFAVDRSETVGLVGESGCGKSVTAKSLLRLLPEPPAHVAGQVLLDGDDVLKMAPPALRQVRGGRIAMIFQEPMSALNPVLSIGYQIMEAIAAHEKVSRRERRDRTVELLREVGIPDPERRIDDYPHQLSGGMRQRVMIAMALSMKPDVLVADEPTTALDVTIQAQILELIARLREERKMGVLLITHDLAVVAETCDRVVVMYAGQIIEEAEPNALFTTPRHPYTRGLLDSVPAGPDRPLKPIPGSVPDLDQLPKACRFHPRCSKKEAKCETDAPALEGAVRCHFPLDA